VCNGVGEISMYLFPFSDGTSDLSCVPTHKNLRLEKCVDSVGQHHKQSTDQGSNDRDDTFSMHG
jgi:hypothetical protein